MNLHKEIEHLIERALTEDIRSGDVTTGTLVPDEARITARLILKQSGVVAGLPFLEVLFQKIDPQIQVELLVQEGSFHKSGTLIAKISGPAKGILTGERVALNLIQHASGIATITAAYVKKLVGLKCAIMDTRKTLPGLRHLEKYAVKTGGGFNHRFGLDDRLVIKSKHFSFLSGNTPYTIQQAVQKLKEKNANLPVEIEIDDEALIEEALKTDVTAIMLSNMTPEEVVKCVKQVRKTDKKVYLESAGAITLDTVRAFAETGVDGISIGDLTHSVKALDIALRLI